MAQTPISNTQPTISTEELIRRRHQINEAYEWVKKGVLQLKQKQTEAAIVTFKHALTLDSANSSVYLGLIDAYTANGELQNAVQTYRTFLYPAPDKRWSSSLQTDVKTLMRFALLLNQTGQKDEALTVYRRALGFLNYADNKPRTEYPLLLDTTFDNSNSENVYTPARLEAAARTAIGMEQWLNNQKEEAKQQLTQALARNPRCASAQLYLALTLKNLVYVDRTIKATDITAAFDKAAQMVHGAASKAAVKQVRDSY